MLKYWYAYYIAKNLEKAFHHVMAISACLAAYRRSVLVELMPILEEREILGVPIKYGEDRFLTRQIVKAGYRTLMTMDAICYTKVPTTLHSYFNQQLRWKRSNIIDFTCGLGHAWRLHPIIGVHYLSMFVLLLVYPFVIFVHVDRGDFFSLVAFHICVMVELGSLKRSVQPLTVDVLLLVMSIWAL